MPVLYRIIPEEKNCLAAIFFQSSSFCPFPCGHYIAPKKVPSFCMDGLHSVTMPSKPMSLRRTACRFVVLWKWLR